MTETHYTQLPPHITLMCALMDALPEHTQVRNATLKLLAARGPRPDKAATLIEMHSVQDPSHILTVAQQVVRLNPTAKISGIKLIRSIFGTSLKDTKLLWEVGASLQGYETRPHRADPTN